MTLAQIQSALAAIEAAVKVAERKPAFGDVPCLLEAKLHRDVLAAIAEGKVYLQDAPELAELALSSLNIKFDRYYS